MLIIYVLGPVAANLSTGQTREEVFPTPIFVHGMWRTGSTYFWEKFRRDPAYRAYLEPLHEMLCRATEADLRRSVPPSVASVLRHPHVDEYYFAEYRVRPEGGVPFFEKYFSYEKYSLDSGASDEPLRAYISSLLETAWQARQQPVLQFNRALLRSGWLRENFPGYSILLLRRPSAIWRSFLSFESLYFVTATCMIVGQNRSDPVLADIARRYEVPFYIGETYEQDTCVYYEFAKENRERLYPLFFEFFLYASAFAARYADCVIDMDAVSESGYAREFVEFQMKQAGLSISLADCRMPKSREGATALWEAQEPVSHNMLVHHFGARLTIPSEKLAEIAAGLSPYFRDLLAN